MNKSTNHLMGSSQFTLETKKQPDGTWQVTSPSSSLAGKVWTGDSESDAIREATKAVNQALYNSELG